MGHFPLNHDYYLWEEEKLWWWKAKHWHIIQYKMIDDEWWCVVGGFNPSQEYQPTICNLFQIGFKIPTKELKPPTTVVLQYSSNGSPFMHCVTAWNILSSNYQFSGAMLVSGRVPTIVETWTAKFSKSQSPWTEGCRRHTFTICLLKPRFRVKP